MLLSCVMAFVLPVLQVGVLRPALVDSGPVASYVVTHPDQYMQPSNIISTPVEATAPAFSIDDYLWLVYVAGTVVVLLLLTLKLYSVFKLTRNNKAKLGSYKMVYLIDTDVAFSFFNYLFIGTRAAGADTIITHELVHIRQKHSADIMFLELLKVICWFNPCIYLLQNSLKTVHEYIADEQTAATEVDALTYSSFLVNNAYGAGGSSITHSFFNYNLLKKRIIMLNQQRSGKLTRLKYLIAVPVCAGLLCASTLAFSKSYGWIVIAPAEKAISLPDTLTTSKGFKYKEKIYSKNGYKYCDVIFFEADGQTKTFKSDPMTANKLNLLKQHYGYEFPEGTVPPPPPPMPPKPKVDQVKFPPVVKPKKTDVVKFQPKPKVDQVKFPSPAVKWQKSKLSPPPPEPPKPKVDQVRFPPLVVKPDAGNTVTGQTKVTPKGYIYEEGAFIADKKGDMFVIIYEKGEGQQPIYRSSATAKQISTLKNKYGYKFPDLKVYPGMPPPPPPMAPVEQPAKPTSSLLNKRTSTKNTAANRVNARQLLIVNGKPFIPSQQQRDRLKSGGDVLTTASDSIITYGKNDPYALSKWGPDAANGVVVLFGKTSVTVK
ncbi:M56 family metallopeptidase [Mucilaginibacter sp. HD30]